MVAVRCPCGQRLGQQWLSDGETWNGGPGIDGVWFVAHELGTYAQQPGEGPALHGLKSIADEDWLRVVCPACGRDWQGREGKVAALISEARRSGRRSGTLV